MSVDSRERFSATVALYDQHRPTYPVALIDWLCREAKLGTAARVVDVGCGTGISTRLFLGRGFTVTGVDPNLEMLEKARAQTGTVFQQGEAAATGLADGCAELVVAMQAFHWFDVEPTLREWRRVLAIGGTAAAVWNVRDTRTPLLRDYEDLLNSIGDYRAVPKPEGTIEKIRAATPVRDLRECEFANVQVLDHEGFLGRVGSSSYVAHGVSEREAFTKKLDALFEKYATNGRVEFCYRAVGLAFAL